MACCARRCGRWEILTASVALERGGIPNTFVVLAGGQRRELGAVDLAVWCNAPLGAFGRAGQIGVLDEVAAAFASGGGPLAVKELSFAHGGV